jgi:hypothetical protein
MNKTLDEMVMDMIAEDARKWAKLDAEFKSAIGALPKNPDDRNLDVEAYYEEIDGEE